MSELHNNSQEHHEQAQNVHEAKARQAELLNDAKEKAQQSKNEHAENLNKIRDHIEQEATSVRELVQDDQLEKSDASDTYWYSQEYREQAFKQLLAKVRSHLNSSEKLASKIIHQPLLEKVSETSSKTVARPSGVLMGSIFSFISSLATYYFARQNGYDMTFSVFFVSFIGGFFVGIAIEFGFRAVRSLLARD